MVGTGDRDVLLAVDGAPSVAGVSAHGSPGKSIHRKKGVFASRGRKAVGHQRTQGGKIKNTETNILALCRVCLPLKCSLKLVKTSERRMQNKDK